GGEFGDPDDRTLARADIVVARDKAFALCGLGGFRIVSRHLIGRPDFAAGDVRAAQPADRREALVGPDDRLAVVVVPGDDAPYLQSHGYPPLLNFRRDRRSSIAWVPQRWGQHRDRRRRGRGAGANP